MKVGFFVVMLFIAGMLFTFGIQPLFNEKTKTGKIVRVELLTGHIGSTNDKCIIAFDDGITLSMSYMVFAEANSCVGKTVTVHYVENTAIFDVVEG
ncbi:hypothetical protein CCP3SC1AL1_1720001 [Gammaproteobacteria bacterium]